VGTFILISKIFTKTVGYCSGFLFKKIVSMVVKKVAPQIKNFLFLLWFDIFFWNLITLKMLILEGVFFCLKKIPTNIFSGEKKVDFPFVYPVVILK